MNFTVYKVSGEILRSGDAPSNMIDIQARNENEFIITEPSDQETQYVDLSGIGITIADKPVMPVIIDKTAMLADGVDVATITGIPEGCTCEVNGQTGVVDDGTLELTFDQPGQYTLNLTVFPFLDYSVVINAT